MESSISRESVIAKRSVVLRGHKTSVSLETQFWESLKGIAARRGMSASALIAKIDDHRGTSNLSSAIRLFILNDLQSRIDDAPPLNARPDLAEHRRIA
jgi:predicted DNA-binding ribbon-helix-helix protein